jgi:hypothetical protein
MAGIRDAYVVQPDAPQGAYTSEQLYNAFSNAETGGVKNPWIRTYGVPGSSSTAFGPTQITYGKVKDYVTRGLVSPESAKFFESVLQPMYENFKTYGREPSKKGYAPAYDYGGTGNFDVAKYSEAYRRLAHELLWTDYVLSNYDTMKTISKWRGTAGDQRYNQAVVKALKGR